LSVLALCELADAQYDANITIDNSTFNNSMTGAFLIGGNITINNSTFNDNVFTGLVFIGNGTINNSVMSGNGVGTTTLGTVTLNEVTIAHNNVGLGIGCDWEDQQVLLNLNNVSFIGNNKDVGSGLIVGTEGSDCENTTARLTFTNSSIISAQSEGEFALDCASVDGYAVSLDSGDLVQLFCPVSGRARVSHLEDTGLPAPLPQGFTYASAFSLDILQNENSIQVITEGGFLKASFDASAPQAGDTYSILYWDNGAWIPVEELALAGSGDASEDSRELLSDVTLVTTTSSPRVEVSTNFPGIFVLAYQ
jgi:hypothetical protein